MKCRYTGKRVVSPLDLEKGVDNSVLVKPLVRQILPRIPRYLLSNLLYFIGKSCYHLSYLPWVFGYFFGIGYGLFMSKSYHIDKYWDVWKDTGK